MLICNTNFYFTLFFRQSILNKAWLFLVLGILGIIFGSVMISCVCVAFKYVAFAKKKNKIEMEL